MTQNYVLILNSGNSWNSNENILIKNLLPTLFKIETNRNLSQVCASLSLSRNQTNSETAITQTVQTRPSKMLNKDSVTFRIRIEFFSRNCQCLIASTRKDIGFAVSLEFGNVTNHTEQDIINNFLRIHM